MPMIDVTDTVINEEVKELSDIINTNPEAKRAYEKFLSECKVRHSFNTIKKGIIQNATDIEQTLKSM